MIVPVMAISNLVLTRQIYSEETNGAHAHYREPVPLKWEIMCTGGLHTKAGYLTYLGVSDLYVNRPLGVSFFALNISAAWLDPFSRDPTVMKQERSVIVRWCDFIPFRFCY